MESSNRTFSKIADERKLEDTRIGKSSAMNSRFESQTAIDVAKLKRQAEWEKVRSARDPLEVPEEKFDGRCLYDQLKQNRDKKDEEFAEIRGIDGSEAKFLEQCSSSIAKVTKEREAADNEAISEFKNARVNNTITLESKSVADTSSSSKSKPVGSASAGRTGVATNRSQSKLLKGAVKRKSAQISSLKDEKIIKLDGDTLHGVNQSSIKLMDSVKPIANDSIEDETALNGASVVTYSDSSDSCSTSDSEIDTSLMSVFIDEPEESHSSHK